jgi:phytanoyl-CoA hydroxylase
MNLEAIVSEYHEHGYVVVRNLLPAAVVESLQRVTDELEAAAAGLKEETSVYDFDAPDAQGRATIQRIKKPHRVHPFYADLTRQPEILQVMRAIVGEDIRLSHSKINMKAAHGGAALEWHQDWAFAPHTNMDTIVASIMIDDASAANGAMQVIADSHKGPLYDHHGEDGFFEGAVDILAQDIDPARAALLEGPAGTVAFHHPLTLHGSGVNRSGDPRRILFLECAACDAFPLFYNVDWEEYESRVVCGSASSSIRVEHNIVKLPFPSRAGSSIYKIQADGKTRYFADAS